MQQFALKGSDRTPTRPKNWYNSKEKVADYVKTLNGLNMLFYIRHEAGYLRHEKLAEFVVLGVWHLDTCGNAMKAHGRGDGFEVTPRQAYAKVGEVIPDVIGMEEMRAHLNTVYTKDDYPHMSFGSNTDLPQAYICCPECGRPWTISDCDDCTVENNTEDLSVEGCVGMTLSDFRRSFAGRTDAIYMFQPELAVRNDRFIDLSPEYPGTDKDWEKDIVKNKFGWVCESALFGATDDVKKGDHCPPNVASYVIQPGDEVFVNVSRYYHKACLQSKVDNSVLAEFQKAFKDAGVVAMLWNEVPNEYGSRSYRGKWYKVTTDMGILRIGWRKRVIEVVFPDWVQVGTLFAKEDTTKDKSLIHAWGYDKLVEYLKAVKEARQP